MSWITPTTTWSDSDTPQPSDFNRIEGNTDYLKDAVDSNDSDILSNASSITSVETRVTTLEGTGSIQGVGTTNAVTFATVNTGQGANELYDMDQNVKTTNSVSFSETNVSSGIALHGTYTVAQVFSALSPLIPTNGDKIILNGGFISGTAALIYSYAQRINLTTIRVYYLNTSAGAAGIASTDYTSGGGASADFSFSAAITIN